MGPLTLTWCLSLETEDDSDLDSKILLSPFQSREDTLHIVIWSWGVWYSCNGIESVLSIDNIMLRTVFAELISNPLQGVLGAVIEYKDKRII